MGDVQHALFKGHPDVGTETQGGVPHEGRVEQEGARLVGPEAQPQPPALQVDPLRPVLHVRPARLQEGVHILGGQGGGGQGVGGTGWRGQTRTDGQRGEGEVQTGPIVIHISGRFGVLQGVLVGDCRGVGDGCCRGGGGGGGSGGGEVRRRGGLGAEVAV